MNEPEAFQLLTLASARDGRTVTQSVAKVWASDLERVDIFDAVDALTLHYRESDKWAMPSHIIECARRVREARERDERIRRQLEPRVEPDPGPMPSRAELDRLTREATEAARAERAAMTENGSK